MIDNTKWEALYRRSVSGAVMHCIRETTQLLVNAAYDSQRANVLNICADAASNVCSNEISSSSSSVSITGKCVCVGVY